MVNLNPMQTALKDAAMRECHQFQNISATIHARKKAEAEAEIAAARIAASLACNRAVQGGVPKQHFLDERAIGTKHYGTFQVFLDLTTEAVAPVDALVVAAGDRFTFDTDSQVVTIAATDREQFDSARAAGAFGWTWEQVQADASLSHARFRIGARGLDPITPDWMPERGDRHPVVALCGPGSDLERAALDWVHEHPGFAKEAA